MKRQLFATIAVVSLLTGGAIAQQPPPTPRPAAPEAPSPATAPEPPAPTPPSPPAPPAATPEAAPQRTQGQLVNIKIDVTVVEEGGTEPPSRKTTTLILADRQNGSVRATGVARVERTPDGRDVVPPAPRMNVDAFPMMQRDGRAQVLLTLDYGRPGAGTSVRVQPLLESGRMLLVSQSIDPASDRRISVELTATILK